MRRRVPPAAAPGLLSGPSRSGSGTPGIRQQAALVARLRAAGCVFAEEEADLLLDAATRGGDLEAMAARRVAGEPLEHVVGRAVFAGLAVRVVPGVFVPRPRSEVLVEVALSALLGRPDRPDRAVVLDLCCGTGALGLAVRAGIDSAGTAVDLHAADVDPAAVACARDNLAGLGTVYCGDLDAPLPPALAGRVDLLVANVPYVPTDEVDLLPAQFRDHEDRRALDGGADGLDVARRVFFAAPRWLAPAGRVLIETATHQVDAATEAARAAGLVTEVTHDDEWRAAVVSAGRYGSPRGPLPVNTR